MGYGLAKAAQMAGAKVTLISGPTALPSPQGVSVVRVETADEMFKAVESHLKKGCIFIGTAAVSDYRVEQAQSQKIKKSNDKSLQLTLTENPDILAFVAASEKPAFVVGFAAETNDVIKHAKAKLKNKKLDMIIANQVGDGQGFDNDHNQVTVITPTQQNALTSTHKTRLAAQIIEILSRTLQNSAQ
jgi:phosphopantothenoylcysteine decarboxylase/phosphopantothenate--cysteine ligase